VHRILIRHGVAAFGEQCAKPIDVELVRLHPESIPVRRSVDPRFVEGLAEMVDIYTKVGARPPRRRCRPPQRVDKRLNRDRLVGTAQQYRGQYADLATMDLNQRAVVVRDNQRSEKSEFHR
jgi:hypothetical protein